MIQSLFYLLGQAFLLLLNFVLGVFTLPYVSDMVDAISWFVLFPLRFRGLFPVTTLFQCLTVLAIVYYARFQIRLVLETLLPMIPFIGKKITLPRIGSRSEND